MKINYKVNSEVKNEFLETYPLKTAATYSFVLKSADEYEEYIGKNVYDLNDTEIEEMLLVQFRNSTLDATCTDASVLRKYVDYCIANNLVAHRINRFVLFTRKRLSKLVSKQATKYRYITMEDLQKYQNMLANAQDVAILEAVYNGIRGRIEKDATLEELINLEINTNSEDFKNNRLKLVKNDGSTRYIIVSNRTMKILVEAKEQAKYISNNGVKPENVFCRESIINKIDDLVFRVPGKNSEKPFNATSVQQRMLRIAKWCQNRFISVSNLYMSGMIEMAKNKYKANGFLTEEDYREIARYYDFNPKSMQHFREAVEHYVIGGGEL